MGQTGKNFFSNSEWDQAIVQKCICISLFKEMKLFYVESFWISQCNMCRGIYPHYTLTKLFQLVRFSAKYYTRQRYILF